MSTMKKKQNTSSVLFNVGCTCSTDKDNEHASQTLLGLHTSQNTCPTKRVSSPSDRGTIIIMKKKINRRDSQSAANWRNTHIHMDRTHSLTHLNQHSYSHVVRSASSDIFNLSVHAGSVRASVIHRTLTWTT